MPDRRHRAPQLAGVDLNLLVVLDALLRTGSASASAQQLGRTPSAVSHALARLREAFDDPLFVRTGPSLRPTPRAEALRAPLADLLDRTRGLFAAGEGFDPARLQRSFAVGSNDLFDNVVLPLLLADLAASAPGVSVVTRTVKNEVERALQGGDVDVAYVTALHTEAGLVVEPVFEDHLQLLLRRGHPALKKPIDVDVYCALRHVLVATRGVPGSPVDDRLAARGRTRSVVLTTPSFTAALRVVAATDLVAALPRHYARLAPRAVVARPLPLAPVSFSFRLAWRAAVDADPAHRWFRARLRRAVLAGYRIEGRAAAAPVA